MWRTVVAGAAATVFTGVAAVPAGAAEGGVSFTRVAVNGGKPIVVGVKEQVKVHATFRMTTRLKYDSGPTVFPYRGNPETGPLRISAIESSDCKVVDSENGICDFTERMYIDPRYLDGNEDAGTWRTAARVLSPVTHTTPTTRTSHCRSSGPHASLSAPRRSRSRQGR